MGEVYKVLITVEQACDAGFLKCLEPSDVIQGIAILISLIVAIITYFTARAAMKSAKASTASIKIAESQLEEMNKQRLDSLKPEIYVKNLKINHSYHKRSRMGVFHQEDEFQADQEIINLRVYLNLNNIGNGPAKRIKAIWKFDLGDSIKDIKEKQEENQFLIDYVPDNKIIINEGGALYLENDLNQDYPVFTVNEEYKMQIPDSYTWILSVLIYLTSLDLNKNTLPPIECIIEYKDISENEYSRKFKIMPKIYGGTFSSQDGKVGSYKFEVFFKVSESDYLEKSEY